MNKTQQKYTAFMESVCKQFSCPEMLPALNAGFKAFCEAISQDSFQPSENPVQVMQWGRDGERWERHAKIDCPNMKKVRRAIDSRIHYLEKYVYNTGDIQVSEMYKGDMHGEPNENGEYYCIKVTGTPDRDWEGRYPNDQYITIKRNMYTDPHQQFGQVKMEDYYDPYDYVWRKQEKLNYKPNKPDSYYNHSPEDRHKLREYVDTHPYANYQGMGVWNRGADYDEEAALNPKPYSDSDAEHAAEQEMERRSEEAFMDRAYGSGNWSY